jgi:hypothetical protein
MSKKQIIIEDIEAGDAVEWYDNGFRCDNVIDIKKGISTLDKDWVVTERYGDILIGIIKKVMVRKDGKLTDKLLEKE